MTIFILPKFMSNLNNFESLQIMSLKVCPVPFLRKVGRTEDYMDKSFTH